MALRGVQWQLREAPSHPSVTASHHVRPHSRKLFSVSPAVRPNPQQPPPGLRCIRGFGPSPPWAPGTTVRMPHGLASVMSHQPLASAGAVIVIPIFQMKTLRGAWDSIQATASYSLPFQEQGMSEPELSVLPCPGFRSREGKIGALPLPAAGFAWRIRLFCCRPSWDINGLVHFLSINQY